jgi:hypothetical protein
MAAIEYISKMCLTWHWSCQLLRNFNLQPGYVRITTLNVAHRSGGTTEGIS